MTLHIWSTTFHIPLHPVNGWALEGNPQGSSHRTKPDKVQELFGQYSQTHGVTLGISCAGPEFHDVYRSLQDILRFYDSMISQRSGKQGLKQHLSTLNPTSLKVFSWSVYECMKMSYIGTLVFCLQKWSCRLMPRAILACFDRWSLHIWPESTTQAFGHKWRNKLETHNQLLSLCKIIGVEAAVLFWFWLCFKNWFFTGI